MVVTGDIMVGHVMAGEPPVVSQERSDGAATGGRSQAAVRQHPVDDSPDRAQQLQRARAYHLGGTDR